MKILRIHRNLLWWFLNALNRFVSEVTDII